MDKVQKIYEEVVRLQNELIQEKEKGYGSDADDACILELQNVLTYIDSLQEEPVSNDFEMALTEMIDKAQKCVVEPWAIAAQWKDELIKLAKSEEPVSEDLGDYINELSKQFPEVSFAKLSRIAVRVSRWQRNQDVKNKLPKVISRTDIDEYAYQCAYDMSNDWMIENPTWHDVEDACKLGANWQKENLWKSANGDDLPEIDREVIVLIKYNAQRNIHDEEYPTYRVGFGHRPNPDGWDGRNIDTNEVTHYTPKLYDKGGWNAPDIAYWLDYNINELLCREK